MAGSPDRSKYQQGIIRRSYEHKDTIALQRLGEVVSDLYLAEGNQTTRLWKSAETALNKLAPSDPRAATILRNRDVEGLAKLVSTLTGNTAQSPATPPQQTSQDPPTAPPSHTPAQPPRSTMTLREQIAARNAAAPPPSTEQLKSAMKAFRKRLKLKLLDDESKLGRSPLTSGKRSEAVAIPAPRTYPDSVWQELARQGRLRDHGNGFYALTE